MGRSYAVFFVGIFFSNFYIIWSLGQGDAAFKISVIHLNDFHARFEEVNENSVKCKDTHGKCIGGIARVYTAVTELLQTRPNAIFLNAGDNFKGTLWYNIFRWNVTQEFLNKLPTDAYTLGNHEFDNAIAGVVPFIKSLNAPVVVANIDASEEPDMMGLFNKSVIVEKNGIRIGIIGVLVARTPKMALTEKLIFLPESASVNEEADRLVAEENVDTIIVVSHCGYDIDQKMARNASAKIGLIVGGHSHSFLYTGDNPPGPDTPVGDYPTIINHEDGRQILIVQASAYTKYLGNITVFYDGKGNVIDWEGAPIFLDNSFEKNAIIEEELQPWKAVVDQYGNVVIGSTQIHLQQENCLVEECLMGDVVADSMAYSVKSSVVTKYPPIALINGGGVRSGLPVGNITYGDARQALPFENSLDIVSLKGKYLKQGLEEIEDNSLLQVSLGFRVTYSSTMKVVSAEVNCSGCSPPGFVPIEDEESYVVVLPSFFYKKGKYASLHTNVTDYTIGVVDIDAFQEYLSENNPITSVMTGRLTILDDAGGGGGESNSGAIRHGLGVGVFWLFVLFCWFL